MTTKTISQDTASRIRSAAGLVQLLDRHARWPGVRRPERERIRDLIARWIDVLRSLGFCVAARRLVTHKKGFACTCGSAGRGGACRRCDGTGWIRLPDEKVTVLFRFVVGDRVLTFHQSEDSVLTYYQEMGDGIDDPPDDVAEKLDRRVAAECVCMVEGVLKAITSPE